jgi:hypothetical protein
VISYDSPHAFPPVDEIEFIFRVEMDGKVEVVFDPLKDQKTVLRAQLGNLSVNFVPHRVIGWVQKLTK